MRATDGELSVLRGATRQAICGLQLATFVLVTGAQQIVAAAQPAAAGAAVLRWQAPPECPTEEDLARRVSVYLERERNPRQLVARAKVERATEGYVLVLDVEASEGHAHRELSDADCAALAESAALLIALAMDPLAGRDATVPGIVDKQPQASDAARDADALSLAVGVAFGGASGLSPGAFVPELGVRLQLRRPPLRLGLDAAFTLPAEARSRAYADARLRLSTLTGRGRVCFDWDLELLALGPCAVAELGSLSSEVRGIDEPRPRRGVWLAGGGGIEATRVVSRSLVLFVGAELLVPADRQRFLIETPSGVVELHRIAAVVVHATAGLGWVF